MGPTHRSRSLSQTNTSKKSHSSKRILSPETNEHPESSKQITKKAKKITITEIDEIKKLLTDSTNPIENKIQESQKSLELQFKDLAFKVNDSVLSLKASVDEFKSEITEEMAEIKTQMNINSQRIDNTEDDIERIKRCSDLRITGIPVKNNERLLDYLNIIAIEIGLGKFTETNTPLIERVPIKNKTTGQLMQSNTIMVHFNVAQQKQSFYYSYLNHMPLNPVKFGLTALNRITIGENLTKKNAQLFKRSQTMKREKKIAQTYTEDGVVKIRLKKGKTEPTYTIRDIITLETLIIEHALLTANEDEEEKELPTKTPSSINAAVATGGATTITMLNGNEAHSAQQKNDNNDNMET